jgi:hypothetical protein
MQEVVSFETAVIGVGGGGDEMLFFLYFVGDAANFGVEVDGEVVEQYLD